MSGIGSGLLFGGTTVGGILLANAAETPLAQVGIAGVSISAIIWLVQRIATSLEAQIAAANAREAAAAAAHQKREQDVLALAERLIATSGDRHAEIVAEIRALRESMKK